MRKHLFAFLATLIVLPAMADNWIKFESAAIEDAINTLVAEENRQFAADEFQKQMDQTTGKISVMGIYKVCAAAGKDINTNKGYDDCRYFINQIAEKSGFGGDDATAANCVSQMNGVWTLSAVGKTDGKYTETYQCVGRDGHVLVYKKSCSNAGGECIKDFADLKTQGPVGREFIAEYARKKNLNLTCKIGFETRLLQDYIKCSAGGKAYEFEFDSLNETPGKTSVESENRAMCEFFGGKIVKHPDKSVEEAWQSCDIDDEICDGEMHRFALRIGHTNQYQGYCRLSRAVSRVGVATLNQIDGVDSYVFYKSGVQMRADQAKVQLEEYLRKTFPGESYINCNPAIKKLDGNGLGADVDYVLTCTVGTKMVDFVFDDLTESSKKRINTGMDAMQCITNGGMFKGETCRGPTQDECTKLDVALRAKGSSEGAKWDDDVRACILGNAMKTYKADVATYYIVGAVVIVGGSVVVIGTGGLAAPVVAGGVEMLVTDLAINYAIDRNHRRLSKAAADRFGDFLDDASKCGDEACALSVLKKHYATLSGVMNDLNKDDQAIVGETMDNLIRLIKTEFVACGENDEGQTVYATPADCAMQSSKLRAIDYIDKASEPVLIIGSIIYNPGFVTSRFMKMKNISKVANAARKAENATKTTSKAKLTRTEISKMLRDGKPVKLSGGGEIRIPKGQLEADFYGYNVKPLDDGQGFFAGIVPDGFMETPLFDVPSQYPKMNDLETWVKNMGGSMSSYMDNQAQVVYTFGMHEGTEKTAISKLRELGIPFTQQGNHFFIRESNLAEAFPVYAGKESPVVERILGDIERKDNAMDLAAALDSKKDAGRLDKAFGDLVKQKQVYSKALSGTIDQKQLEKYAIDTYNEYVDIIAKDPELAEQALKFRKLSLEKKQQFAAKLSDSYNARKGCDGLNCTYKSDLGDSLGSHSSGTTEFWLNPTVVKKADLNQFLGTVAHENNHYLDEIGKGALNPRQVKISEATDGVASVANNLDGAIAYRSHLTEQASYAVSDVFDEKSSENIIEDILKRMVDLGWH